MAWEILLALFGTIGVIACLKYVRDRLLFPVKGVMILIPAKGNGQRMEHMVKGVRALSSSGMLEGEAVFLADMGLDEDGLAAAEALCRRYPELQFCVLEDIETV